MSALGRLNAGQPRAYHWGEDGLAGFSDDKQRLCFALADVPAIYTGRPYPEEGHGRCHLLLTINKGTV
jgi:hypothetical protein